MLTHLISIAVALYYQRKDPRLGLSILLESWSENQLPPDFLRWWTDHSVWLSEQCHQYYEMGIRFTCPGCVDYPRSFIENLDKPPLFISYRGSAHWDQNANLAVVGSRKMSTLTSSWINEELFEALKKNTMTIVSGGARGVDQAAHLVALRGHRPTFVFMPSGLDRIYPRDLRDWIPDVVASGGSFISEYWPNVEIKKHHFLERNRLIASISDHVLVAQGEQRSGTMLTAQWAIELGRELAVIPGHPKDQSFSGNSQLLRLGALPMMDHQDLLVWLGKK